MLLGASRELSVTEIKCSLWDYFNSKLARTMSF